MILSRNMLMRVGVLELERVITNVGPTSTGNYDHITDVLQLGTMTTDVLEVEAVTTNVGPTSTANYDHRCT